VLPVLRALAVVAIVLLAILAVAFLAQRRLLYFPTPSDLSMSVRVAASRGLVPWTGPDGAFLGWRSPHPGGAPVARVIVLHGNAGTALDRAYLRDVVRAPGVPPLDVYLMEYPGYGPRTGSPSEASILAATTGAIALLGNDLPILLVGESLGSAVAVLAAAARAHVAGLLLVTPVSSVTALARHHYPVVPSFLVRDPFRADLALPGYRGRVAFLLAGRDEVAPPGQARALFEAFPGTRRLWEEPEATHNTLRYRPGDPVWADVWRFLLA
jgi:pimeloyl-ACP methyl ester carboxylesterase